MKLKLIPILTLVMASSLTRVGAQEPVTVAVYDFRPTGGPVRDDGPKITALVTTDLSGEPSIALIERAQLTKALNEQAFGASGMVNSDVAAKIGQLTGAKVLVAGQVFRTSQDHLVIVANVIGTETARLFTARVEGGAAGDLVQMTSDLSGKIVQIISTQMTNLVAAPEEAREKRLERIVKTITGKNRPTVSVDIQFFGDNRHWRDDWADDEFGAILLKAGFTVLDGRSDRKPDIEISGNGSTGDGIQRGDFVSRVSSIEIKMRDRRSGEIIGFDRQESIATGIGANIVGKASHDKAVDELAERILPLLANWNPSK